jgi:Cu(I)/Ag(I) efflux system protein CusF
MKLGLIAVFGIAGMLSFAAWAEDMAGMKMQQESQSSAVASAEGTIKAIDPVKHTVTLAHGAVPALQWPPMTMGFSVAEEQLAGFEVGDRVVFSFRVDGGRAVIVSMKK